MSFLLPHFYFRNSEICLQPRPPLDTKMVGQMSKKPPPIASVLDRKVNGELFCESKKLPLIAPLWKEIQGSHDWNGLLDPLDDNFRAEIIRYGEFAQVCYDGFDSDTHSKYCGSCKFNQRKLFREVDMSHCGYEVTTYLYATSALAVPELLRFPHSSERWSAQSNWIGFVAVCTNADEIRRLGRRDILVAWRGTQTATEWAANLQDFLEAPTFRTHDAVKVESGFLSVYCSALEGSIYNNQSSRDQLLPEIQRLLHLYKDEELSITMTGHSLGGALATLSSYDIAQSGLNRVRRSQETDEFITVPLTVFTFGCPRVGNRFFRDACKKLDMKILRVVNINDLVPKVPGVFGNERSALMGALLEWMPWTYFHAGTQISVNNEHSQFLKRTVDLGYLHNMEAYLHLIDGYVGPRSSKFMPHGRDHALVNKHSGLLIDELLVPEEWWQEKNKGMAKNEKGQWVQPDREEDDKPESCTPSPSPTPKTHTYVE